MSARPWWLVPVLVTGLIYLPALADAEFVSDDWMLLAHHQNPGDILGEWTRSTHGQAGGSDGYVWRPLVATAHQLVGMGFGRSPLPYRLLNVLVHGAVVAFVWRQLRRDGVDARAAGLLAGAWAAWPPLVDAVGWASDTYDPAAALFGLLALRSAEAANGRLVGVFVCTLAACLSKETAAALAVALPAWVALRQGPRAAVGPGAAAILAAVVHAGLHQRVTGFATPPPELAALWTWLDMTGWPLLLGIDDGFLHVGVPSGPTLSGGLGLVLLLALSVPARTRPAAALWALMLAPAAVGAAAIGQETWRYAYVPSALAAASLGGLRLPRAWVLPVGAAVLTIAWAPRSWQRAEAWRDDGAIAEAELAVVPDNPLALQIVGRRRVALGDVGGFEMWEAAIARAPGNTFLLDPQRQRLDLATAAWQLGDAPRARRVLADFVRGEAEAGREVAPDVRHLQAAVEAAPAPGLPARPEHSEPP